MEKKGGGSLAIILLALGLGFPAFGAVEIQPSANPAVAGQNLTLSLSPSANMQSGSWAVGATPILTWQGDKEGVYSSHVGKATVNTLTGALTLSFITAADSGVYVVQGTNPQLSANVSIIVLEPISDVTLEANQTDLVEFSGPKVMKCSVSSGSSLSFLWLNGSSEVTASQRAQLTDGNATLTIANVSRYDHGPFSCRALNPVSNGTSDPVSLNVIYGPDNMALRVNGSQTVGSNLTMLCSAQSNPPAQLHWAFSGVAVNTTGPRLELHGVTEAQSGPYSCLALNNQTNSNSSITSHITITKSAASGLREQATNVWHFSLLLLAGFLLSGVK